MNCNLKRLFFNKWFLLFINVFVFALMAWLLPIHFEENDDVVMCMIANGKCSGSPDGHLVFINALYGWVIAGWYMMSSAVEWYTLSFCVIQIFAMTGIVYVLVKDGGISVVLKGLLLVFVYVIWARIIMGFQFTTTAGLLCFSGCLAMLRSSWRWKIVGFGAIFLASLIRFKAAALVGLMCVPMFTLEFTKSKRIFLWIVCVAFLCLLGKWFDGMFYKSPDWSAYKTYNEVRGFIHDNPNAGLMESDLPEGVSMEDYQMFRFFCGDPQVMTLPKLQAIKSSIKGKMSARQVMVNLSQLKLYRIPIVLLLVGMALSIVVNLKTEENAVLRRITVQHCRYMELYRNSRLFSSIILLIMTSLICIYLGMTATLKNRVFLCIIVPATYQMVRLFSRKDWNQVGLQGIIMAIVVGGLIIKYVNQDGKVIRTNQSGIEGFNNYQYPLVMNQTGMIYTGAFRCEFLPPFEIKAVTFRLVGFGWQTGIPFQIGILESHRDFVDSDILCFSTVNEPLTGIQESIERNYGVKSNLEMVNHNEKYALFKFVLE